MKIDIITLFPEMFDCVMKKSILGRAIENGLIKMRYFNPREFTKDKYRTVDGQPFGGGCGMVLKPEPVYSAIKKASGGRKRHTIFLSPQGKAFNQAKAVKLAKKKHLILLCGHYEGIDERIMKYVDEEISIGDYVLTGGEIAAMVVADAVARNIPGVVKAESVEKDSFTDGLLDYPCYTRPRKFRGMGVPEVLLSGNHEKIKEWRLRKSYENTRLKRPDLYKALQKTGKK